MTAHREAVAPPRSPALLGWPVAGLRLRWKLALLAVAAAALVAAGFLAYERYPRAQTRTATDLERQLAATYRDPAVPVWDENLIGDLLVERFYIVDLETGQRYVADLLKGYIDDVEVVPREDIPPATVFLLESRNMRRDKAFFNAYLKGVTDETALPAHYLGAVMPAGDSDAFPANYGGEIFSRQPFLAEGIDDPYSYAVRQDYKEMTSPRGIGVLGYVYVLNNSDLLPVFKTEFGLGKTAFVSELFVVDTTARDNRLLYYRLLEQYPRSRTP
jgi:hypothetical protein